MTREERAALREAEQAAYKAHRAIKELLAKGSKSGGSRSSGSRSSGGSSRRGGRR